MARYARSNTRMFVFKGTTPPTTLNGASVGDQWTDTSVSPCLEYKCTSISPMTWVTAEGSGGGGGGLSDGDYGDITVSGSGTALTIDNTVVTFAKMQNVSTGVLIGRSTASTGSMETITPGTGLSLSGGTLASTITQYTDEQAQDTVATMIQNGTGISWTYNDVANTLTPAVSLASFSTTNLAEGSNLYYTTERAQDDVLGVISASNGIVYTYTDASNVATIAPTYGTLANTICQGNDSRLSDSRAPNGSASGDLTGTYPGPTIATSAVTNAKMANMAASTLKGNATGGAAAPTDLTVSSVKTLLAYTTTDVTEGSNLYYTDERAQDAVGTILTDSSTVDFTYNDAANTISAAVIANTSTQKVEITKNSGAVVGTRKQLNFIEGSNVTLTIGDDAGNDQVDITIAASGGGGISDGDKGDITVSGSGATWTVDNDAITFAKMQNINTNKLLGRSTASSGDVEEISIGSGLSLSGGSLSSTAAGDVTTSGSVTDNAVVRYDSTSGDSIQTSYATIADDGTMTTSIDTGACEGGIPAVHWIMLTSDYTLTSTTAVQQLFDTTTNGTITLPTGVYMFEAFIYLTTMSATSGNAAFSLAGTATTDRFGMHASGLDNNNPLNSAARGGSASVTSSFPASMVTAGTGTGMTTHLTGMFRISTGGTIIPSIKLVTAAAAVVKAGTWFRIAKIGESSETYKGAWT